MDEPFTVHVFGSPYLVEDDLVKIPVPDQAKPKLYKRRRPENKPAESAIDMQKRIEENIVDLSRQRVRLQPPCFACRAFILYLA